MHRRQLLLSSLGTLTALSLPSVSFAQSARYELSGIYASHPFNATLAHRGRINRILCVLEYQNRQRSFMFELESGLLRRFSNTMLDERNFSASLGSHLLTGILHHDESNKNFTIDWEDEDGNQGTGTGESSIGRGLIRGMAAITALSLLAASNNIEEVLENGGTASGQLNAIVSERPVGGDFTLTSADGEDLEEG